MSLFLLTKLQGLGLMMIMWMTVAHDITLHDDDGMAVVGVGLQMNNNNHMGDISEK